MAAKRAILDIYDISIKSQPFKYRPLKSPVFECFRFSKGQFSDPHCYCNYLPARKASKKVANLIERKNVHTPVYVFKEFVCLSVTNFDPYYS